MDFDWDCIVIGGGPAGLSAALTLGRARRRVLVLDDGAPRNHAALAMHGVLGHDGMAPAQLRSRGREEVARYGIEVRDADADAVALVDGGVVVDGERAHTLILATGLLDEVPPIDGFADLYGVSAHTCPYCDGWEHADERIAVLAAEPEIVDHLGGLLRQWSADVELLAVDEVARFESEDGRLRRVHFADGRPPLERDALFFHLALHPRSVIAQALGCAVDAAGFVEVADDRQTTVDRVYAVGNVADARMNVPMVIADGARAGVAVNVRLVQEGYVQPGRTSPVS